MTGIPMLRMGNLLPGRILWDDLQRVTVTKEERVQYLLKPGDLLFNRTNSAELVGKSAVFDIDREAVFASYLVRFRLRSTVADPYFVCGYISSPQGRRFIVSRMARAIGQVNISASTMQQMPIPLPPLVEQRRIAERLKEQLAAVTAARAAAQAQSQELDALVIAVLRDSLAVPGGEILAADVVLDEMTAGVGARWRDYPVIGATRNGWAPAKEPVGKAPERYKLVEPGMIFYNPMRIMIGSIAAVSDPEQVGITSPDYVVVKPKPAKLDSIWFYDWFRSNHGVRFIASLARGAVRERMLFSRLRKGVFHVPPLTAQQRFASVCSAARETQAKLTAQLAALDALPAALLREAFSA